MTREMERRPESMTEEQIRAATVGEPQEHAGPIELADYDPAWPGLFAREARRIRATLRERALRIEHVGSTAVPGLAAKPIIDILLIVGDSADEETYVPALLPALAILVGMLALVLSIGVLAGREVYSGTPMDALREG